MNFRLLLFFAALGLPMSSVVRSEITLAPVFADHAVLQRDRSVPIWGRATPGEKIAVTFRDQTVHATTDINGRWIVVLASLTGTSEPAELVITGGETVVMHDVVVGEVWLAAGQSNMEWPVSYLHPDEQKIAAADLPLVRHLKIEHTVAGAPAETVKTSGWKLASPQTVGEFTAIGYFFARDLQRKLGVPVGIIHTSWGGAPIEAWMSDTARHAAGLSEVIDARWEQAMKEWPPERVALYPADMEKWQQAEEQAKATKTRNPLPWPRPPATPDSPDRPGGLFNAMIAPLQPAAIRGVLWYQGESNVGRPAEYAKLFPALIEAWRGNWGDSALPFLFVQVPNYADDNPRGRQWAQLREAQARALDLPATGMAVAIDVGEAGNLHPTKKRELARRLALIARNQVYGIPGDYSGPVFAGFAREGTSLRIRFDHAGGALIAGGRIPQALELAGPDRVFHPAVGVIQGETLLVSAKEVKDPVAVRYAWSNAPIANLYNAAGLPVAPFRSDDW